MNCVDSFPLAFLIEPYKEMIKVDKENLSVSRLAKGHTFWTEAVKGVADAWATEDVC